MQGLTTEQYRANLPKYGPNCMTAPPQMPAWLKFLLQFTNFFALLLLAGGTLCFIGYAIDSEKDPTDMYLGFVLYFVVIVTATFSHFQEAKSEQIMEGKELPLFLL